MPRQHIIFLITAFAIVNGIFSPFLPYAVAAVRLLAPGLLIFSAPVLFLFGSLLLSTMTIIAAGVPAALYERLAGRKESDDISSLIWLAGTALLSLQAITVAAGIFF
ncbi:MAG: hypothetical protein H6883_02900 [Rhodobiaceae bacterium]|nr:hypothetical protein [Rhodobiaceae bacterium]MCC0055066.1 hypothetical protein [Rhodobiaceae bacterium]